MKSRAHYSTEVRGDVIILVDYDDGSPTITNQAEETIADLRMAGLLTAERRVIYLDTDKEWDELEHDGQQFTGFKRVAGDVTLTELLEAKKLLDATGHR